MGVGRPQSAGRDQKTKAPRHINRSLDPFDHRQSCCPYELGVGRTHFNRHKHKTNKRVEGVENVTGEYNRWGGGFVSGVFKGKIGIRGVSCGRLPGKRDVRGHLRNVETWKSPLEARFPVRGITSCRSAKQNLGITPLSSVRPTRWTRHHSSSYSSIIRMVSPSLTGSSSLMDGI